MQSIESKMLRRIKGHGKGWSFFDNDFLDLGRGPAIRQALSRLEQAGSIRRIMRGLYDFPEYSEHFDTLLPPDLTQAAQALARKHGWTIHVSGQNALNILGLSTQVPLKHSYLSSGPTRSFNIGNQTIHFKKTSMKDLDFKLKDSALLIQAIKALGRNHITESIIKKITQQFTIDQIERISKDTRYATSWAHEIIMKIKSTYAQAA